MLYGLFILKSGKWTLHLADTNRAFLENELAYLTGSLGLTAKLFKRGA